MASSRLRTPAARVACKTFAGRSGWAAIRSGSSCTAAKTPVPARIWLTNELLASGSSASASSRSSYSARAHSSSRSRMAMFAIATAATTA